MLLVDLPVGADVESRLCTAEPLDRRKAVLWDTPCMLILSAVLTEMFRWTWFRNTLHSLSSLWEIDPVEQQMACSVSRLLAARTVA